MTIPEPQNEHGPRIGGYAIVAVAAVLWSLGGVFIKVLTGHYAVDPRALACVRSAFGGLALAWALPGMRGAPVVRTGAATLAIAVVFGAFVVSTVETTAANAIFLQYAYPLVVAAGAVLIFRERLGGRTVAALAVGMAGVGTILVGSWRPTEGRGMLLGFATAFALGAFTLLQRSIKHRSPVAASSFYNLAAALLLLPLAWGRFAMSGEALGVLALMGIVQLSVPYVLFIHGLKTVPATDVALITLIEPILNPVWVWLAVGEAPLAGTLVGGALILLALVVRAGRLPLALRA